MKNDGNFTSVNLTVASGARGPGRQPYRAACFWSFIEEKSAGGSQALRGSCRGRGRRRGGACVPDLDAYIVRLKQELRAKDEYLQTAIEELETSNEELRSAHEEMQSVNEEMQSTNEELETSKEELQSVNEELATVNNELQTKVADLSRSNNDMKNLLSGTGIGTIFVDHHSAHSSLYPSVSRTDQPDRDRCRASGRSNPFQSGGL